MIVSNVSAQINVNLLRGVRFGKDKSSEVSFCLEKKKRNSRALSAATLAGLIAAGTILNSGCDKKEEAPFEFDKAAVECVSAVTPKEQSRFEKILKKTYEGILSSWIDKNLKVVKDDFYSFPYDKKLLEEIKSNTDEIKALREAAGCLLDSGEGINADDMSYEKIYFLRNADITPDLYMKNLSIFAGKKPQSGEVSIDEKLLQIQSQFDKIQKASMNLKLLASLRDYFGQAQKDLQAIENMPLLTNFRETQLVATLITNVKSKIAKIQPEIDKVENLPALEVSNDFVNGKFAVGEFFPNATAAAKSLSQPSNATEEEISSVYSDVSNLEVQVKRLTYIAIRQNEAFYDYTHEVSKEIRSRRDYGNNLKDSDYSKFADSYMFFRNNGKGEKKK